MQSVAETIQAMARQRGRGDAGPLIALRQLDGAPGERVSHLPVDRDLSQAWLAMTGEAFRPHQAQALAALRRGEPVALRASSADVATSAHLLMYAALVEDRFATALVLAHDSMEALASYERLAEINESLPVTLRLPVTLVGQGQRPSPYTRVVVSTPEALHGRLLRHHERAWRQFWPALRLIAVPDIQRYAGIAGAHLADLLLRSLRVITGHGGAGAAMLATLTEVAEPEPALTSLLGQPWRIVGADDGPRGAPILAVWDAGSARLRDSAELALGLQRQGYRVHILCGPLEQGSITPVVGDAAGISTGPRAQPAQVVVCVGHPGSTSELRRLLHSGYQAAVVVLGEQPHEQAIERHVEALVSGLPPAWPPPPANAYVTAQHVLCAASELPLTASEIEAWGAQEVVDRLAAHQQLVNLPDPDQAWKPADAAGDPYADFSLLAATGAPITARTEQGQVLGTFDPTGFERWTFAGAALPPGANGMRVLARDEERGTITVRMETSGRRTYPLRRCTVELREARETRTLAGGKQVGWGRVVVSEEIYGYREAGGGQVGDTELRPALKARWAAPACWFEVGLDLQVLGQFIGWSMAAALPLRVLASFTDVVPCYDHAARRLYVVDAQPGGSGLALWTYTHAEELLPVAYDIALACRGDALLEPLSRVDQDWLLSLLGRSMERVQRPEERRSRSSEHGAPRGRGQAEASPALSLPGPELLMPPMLERHDAAPSAPEYREPPASRRSPPAEQHPPALPLEPRPASHAPQERPVPRPERQGAQPPIAGATNRELWDTAERTTPARPPAQPPHEAEPPFPAPPHEERRLVPERASPPREERRPAPGRGAPPGDPTPPPAGRPAEPAAQEERLPDAAALIERLRRQRQQREPQQANGGASTSSRAPRQAAVERRFAAGDRIFCLPYGDGVVRESRLEEGREVLTVQFPDHGELEVDPAVSLVRKLDDAPALDDDLL
ncbi:MAG: hypothetical protein RLZZ387_4405 [Chloroflexota bacterium]|jgi:hypothetical protein